MKYGAVFGAAALVAFAALPQKAAAQYSPMSHRLLNAKDDSRFRRGVDEMLSAIGACDRARYDAAVNDLRALQARLGNATIENTITPVLSGSRVDSQTARDERLKHLRNDRIAIQETIRTMPFPEDCAPKPKISVGAEAGIIHLQASPDTESFGFRLGGVGETFLALPLKIEDTTATGSVRASLKYGDLLRTTISFGGFDAKASTSAALVPSNGNDLLLPGATNSGFSLAGGGNATDVENASNAYTFRQRHLDIRSGLPTSALRYLRGGLFGEDDEETVSRGGMSFMPHVGLSYHETSIDHDVSGSVPNFGFGADFGFAYNTDIDVSSVGFTLGGKFKHPLGQWGCGDAFFSLGGEVGLFRQDVDANDHFFLGDSTTTLADQNQNLDRTDTAINYSVSTALSWNIVDDKVFARGTRFKLSASYFNTDDGYFVRRSGAVGGHAQLARDRVDSFAGQFRVTVPFF